MAGIEGMLAEISAEFPGFRLLSKRDSRLMAWIHRALQMLTLGRQSRFLTEYHTVIGYTLYVAPTWEQLGDIERIALLRHERVHLRQRRRFGLWGLAFLYLVPFFPIGLAYFRARLEWEAYTETIRALLELRGKVILGDRELRERIIGRFVGPDYGWMWPFRSTVEKWYDNLILQLSDNMSDNGRGSNHQSANVSIFGLDQPPGKEPKATWEQS
jgi:hypothetical protein